jgi:hypothetical protein
MFKIGLNIQDKTMAPKPLEVQLIQIAIFEALANFRRKPLTTSKVSILPV